MPATECGGGSARGHPARWEVRWEVVGAGDFVVAVGAGEVGACVRGEGQCLGLALAPGQAGGQNRSAQRTIAYQWYHWYSNFL